MLFIDKYKIGRICIFELDSHPILDGFCCLRVLLTCKFLAKLLYYAWMLLSRKNWFSFLSIFASLFVQKCLFRMFFLHGLLLDLVKLQKFTKNQTWKKVLIKIALIICMIGKFESNIMDLGHFKDMSDRVNVARFWNVWPKIGTLASVNLFTKS